MKAFIIAEQANAATKLAAAARIFADEVAVVVIGTDETPDSIADEAYHLSVPASAILDDAAETLSSVIRGAEVVLGESTRRIKAVIGKLAAKQGAAVLTDILSVDAGVVRSMYFGGIAQSQKKATTSVAFYTQNPDILECGETSGSASVQELDWVAPDRAVKKVASEPIVRSGVDLSKVDVVVAAGRGFAEQESLVLAQEFCAKVGGGLGCTRPMSEAVRWFPTESYIGVSGLMLAPKVYVGIGVSGQMQHMVGINTADKVFAINKDKNAPIFKQCDFGIVGDLKLVLPALNAALG